MTASTDPLSSSTRGFLLTTSFTPLFVSNFVGVCFARTLHYQFYSWYFHSLPLMLWTASDNLHLTMRVILLGTVEYGFNVFPATEVSSIALQTSHFIWLACIWFGRVPDIIEMKEKEEGNEQSRENSEKTEIGVKIELTTCRAASRSYPAFSKFSITHQIWFKDPYWFRHNPGPRTKRENLAGKTYSSYSR